MLSGQRTAATVRMNRMIRLLTNLLVAACFCLPVHATDFSKAERVLFPLWTDSPVDGANGSKWNADAMINNPGASGIAIYPIVSIYGRTSGDIGPRATCSLTFLPDTYLGIGNGTKDDIAGRILYVDRAGADQLVYLNRLYDLTRSPAYAVDIPVVRERDLKSSRLTLANVPLDPRVRTRLRVYDPFQTAGGEVVVRFWAEWPVSNIGAAASFQPPQLLGSISLKLHTTVRPPDEGDLDVEPAYAELPITPDLLSNIPPYSTAHFSIDVEPVTPGLRFWAFVSVTDNESQHVLLITPH